MARKSPYDDEYDYDDVSDDARRRLRHFKKEKDQEQRKRWDRESQYDRDHDYDERR